MLTDNFAYLIIEGHYALMRFADVNPALAVWITTEGHTPGSDTQRFAKNVQITLSKQSRRGPLETCCTQPQSSEGTTEKHLLVDQKCI